MFNVHKTTPKVIYCEMCHAVFVNVMAATCLNNMHSQTCTIHCYGANDADML